MYTFCKYFFSIEYFITTTSSLHIKSECQAQIQNEQVRVTGKKRDDLQSVMSMLKAEGLGIPLQFKNLRD